MREELPSVSKAVEHLEECADSISPSTEQEQTLHAPMRSCSAFVDVFLAQSKRLFERRESFFDATDLREAFGQRQPMTSKLRLGHEQAFKHGNRQIRPRATQRGVGTKHPDRFILHTQFTCP